MLPQIRLSNPIQKFLVNSLLGRRTIHVIPFKSLPYKVNAIFNEKDHCHYKSSSSPPNDYQQSSLFRSFVGFSIFVGGLSAVVYFVKPVRDLIIEQIPQTKPYFLHADETYSQWTMDTSSINPIDWIKTNILNSLKAFQNQTQDFSLPSKHIATPNQPDFSPDFPSVSDVTQQVEMTEHLIEDGKSSDLATMIRTTEHAVQIALADLRHLESTTKKHIEEQCRSQNNNRFGLRNAAQILDPTQQKAIDSHKLAQKHLAQLRSLLDVNKKSVSEKEMDLINSAIISYGDLAYELSGHVIEVRRLQHELKMCENFAEAENTHQSKLHEQLESILVTADAGDPTSEMSAKELNSLLSMALEQVNTLCTELKKSGSETKKRLGSVLEAQRKVFDAHVKEAVNREVSHLHTKWELEKLEMEKESNAKTEHELNLSLAKHGRHLAQMLLLKQEELEHLFEFRLREAVVNEKIELEARLNKWIKRMEAIEHVVNGRAEIDRIAKETQDLWLSVEALAFSIEMPFSKIGSTESSMQNKSKPFYTSEPLEPLVAAIKTSVMNFREKEFVMEILNSLSDEALSKGVWTRHGLLNRFNKVYDVCRNVAMVDEVSTSLWGYFMSWMQAKLTFDSLKRQRLVSQLPGLKNTNILTPDTEVDSDNCIPDTFSLLASSKAALMPETDTVVNMDAVNCSDLEFAVRVLGQLQGQPAVVAADWIADARRFLEVHQAVQALLAFATAKNISVFQDRL